MTNKQMKQMEARIAELEALVVTLSATISAFNYPAPIYAVPVLPTTPEPFTQPWGGNNSIDFGGNNSIDFGGIPSCYCIYHSAQER
jgi:hypothetical protein